MSIKTTISGVTASPAPNLAQVTYSQYGHLTPRQTPCPRCIGTGKRGGSRPDGSYHHIECARCSGTGMLDVPQDVLRAIQLGVHIQQLEAELVEAQATRQSMDVPAAMGWGDYPLTSEGDGLILACEMSILQPKAELQAIREQREYRSWQLFISDNIIVAVVEAKRAKEEARKIASYKTRSTTTPTTPLQGKRVTRVVPEGERLTDPFASAVSRELIDGVVVVTVSGVVR